MACASGGAARAEDGVLAAARLCAGVCVDSSCDARDVLLRCIGSVDGEASVAVVHGDGASVLVAEGAWIDGDGGLGVVLAAA